MTADPRDVTWTSLTEITWHYGIVYEERRVRDWRFLWLRHRTIVEILEVMRPEVQT